jgi:uncharacterized protein
MTRILAFSDLHLSEARAEALVEMARRADLVIGAGDFCTMRRGLAEIMALLEPIEPKAVYVPGNAESATELKAATRAKVLHGTGFAHGGLTLFGLGYAVPKTPFGAWSCDLSEATAGQMLELMEAADILISHSPPKGVADLSSRGDSLGSQAVRAAIERVQPRLCLCGHIHDSWGKQGEIGRTKVINLGPEGLLLEV